MKVHEILPGDLVRSTMRLTLWDCHVEDHESESNMNDRDLRSVETSSVMLVLDVRGTSIREEARVLVEDGTTGWVSTKWIHKI